MHGLGPCRAWYMCHAWYTCEIASISSRWDGVVHGNAAAANVRLLLDVQAIWGIFSSNLSHQHRQHLLCLELVPKPIPRPWNLVSNLRPYLKTNPRQQVLPDHSTSGRSPHGRQAQWRSQGTPKTGRQSQTDHSCPHCLLGSTVQRDQLLSGMPADLHTPSRYSLKKSTAWLSLCNPAVHLLRCSIGHPACTKQPSGQLYGMCYWFIHGGKHGIAVLEDCLGWKRD